VESRFYKLLFWTPQYNVVPHVLWPDGTIPTYIDQLNFNPVTLDASTYVDGVPYDAELLSRGDQHLMGPFTTDPTQPMYPTVAGFNLKSRRVLHRPDVR